MKKSRRKKPDTYWIALSSAGHPVPFIGYTMLRKDLAAHYREKFGHDIERAGYRLVRVEMRPVAPKEPR